MEPAWNLEQLSCPKNDTIEVHSRGLLDHCNLNFLMMSTGLLHSFHIKVSVSASLLQWFSQCGPHNPGGGP